MVCINVVPNMFSPSLPTEWNTVGQNLPVGVFWTLKLDPVTNAAPMNCVPSLRFAAMNALNLYNDIFL